MHQCFMNKFYVTSKNMVEFNIIYRCTHTIDYICCSEHSFRVNFSFAFLSHLKVSDLLNEWTFLNAKPR